MNVSFNGMNENIITFEVEQGATIQEGDMVLVSDNGTVKVAETQNDVPLGVAVQVRGGFASVQVTGYVKVPCESAVELGFLRAGISAAGKLCEMDGGREVFVTDISDNVCGILL